MRINADGAFLAGATLLVIAAVVAGVVVVGSPQHARALKLDEERLDDLETLSRIIDVHYRREKALPPSLDRTEGEFGDLKAAYLVDPDTGVRYEYRVRDQKNYVLCAHFAADAPEDTALEWRHGAGRTCFDFNAARGGDGSADFDLEEVRRRARQGP